MDDALAPFETFSSKCDSFVITPIMSMIGNDKIGENHEPCK